MTHGYMLNFLTQNPTDMEIEFLCCKACVQIIREATFTDSEYDFVDRLVEKEWELLTLKQQDGVERKVRNVNELKVEQIVEGLVSRQEFDFFHTIL